jgi:hypothetical protein
MKSTRFLLQVAGLSAILAGCVGTQPGQAVHFLRQKDTDGPQMLALMEGRLALTEGCLRIQSSYGEESYAAIWPFEFSFSKNGGNVHILNGEGQVVAQVGDQIRVSGGEIPGLSEEEFEENFIGTFECSGRYWIVNSGVEAITP